MATTLAHPAATSATPSFVRPRPRLPSVTASGLRYAAANVLLALAFFAAAWPNLRHLERGPADAIWAAGAVVMGALSLVRVPPRTTRIDLRAFAATAAMLAMPCLMRPAAPSAGLLQWSGLALELFGVALSQAARIFMGRRFGILPANRGIVSSGPFRWVRHPIYAGWLMLSLGFALAYPSWRNFAIVLATMPAAMWRIRVEEALLAEDPEYRRYRAKVGFILIPRLL